MASWNRSYIAASSRENFLSYLRNNKLRLKFHRPGRSYAVVSVWWFGQWHVIYEDSSDALVIPVSVKALYNAYESGKSLKVYLKDKKESQ